MYYEGYFTDNETGEFVSRWDRFCDNTEDRVESMTDEDLLSKWRELERKQGRRGWTDHREFELICIRSELRQRRIINRNGQLIDSNGRMIDSNGRFIDRYGKLLPKKRQQVLQS
jgi:predicted DNA-binding WGR domain protein